MSVVGVADRDRVRRFVSRTLRGAGRQLEEARQAYQEGRTTASLPRDEDGKARIVCRRYAERRSVGLDDHGRPECFDPDHPDCRGCAEDVRDGVVETW
ncbi:hypothetical protein SAMN06269185_3008 [Natronoarchaeum philippinense]|uniref:Uncharacterized protein n=1 Tax=Natronoarchaeum philippinense TaxID=558529 RepID=A0A285P863_NATPI|nr:hypothetical protein SAMN06269185_3008 [Natronoarchaeum philippinense]